MSGVFWSLPIDWVHDSYLLGLYDKLDGVSVEILLSV